MINIHTDGSCIHNANVSGSAIGPGGYAAILFKDDHHTPFHTITGGHEATTNNIMEIGAALESLKYLDSNHLHDTVTIYSDSQYVINSINTWLKGWEQNNFRKIKNAELWKEMSALIKRFPKVNGVWVKGHNGDPKNEEVNRLAQNHAYSIKG